MRLIDKDNNVEKLNARRENFSTSHAPVLFLLLIEWNTWEGSNHTFVFVTFSVPDRSDHVYAQIKKITEKKRNNYR